MKKNINDMSIAELYVLVYAVHKYMMTYDDEDIKDYAQRHMDRATTAQFFAQRPNADDEDRAEAKTDLIEILTEMAKDMLKFANTEDEAFWF